MRFIEVKNNGPLRGSIEVPGSKNSSLGLLPACCLSSETVILKNIPKIMDMKVIRAIADDIGLIIRSFDNHIEVDPTGIFCAEIDPKKSDQYRASYYFIGALLAKFKKVSIGYPGGDNFGSRPIDQHIKGLEALGAQFTYHKDFFIVEAEELYGADIYFDVITSGATINVLLASVLAKGRTILRNAARDPEIVDIAIMLNSMGAQIKGAGTSTITIDGVLELHGCCHSAIPDRLIAGAYLMAAGISGGSVTVKGVIPEHLQSCTLKLSEAGLYITEGDNFVTAQSTGILNGISVKTAMYPGFGTDYQQPLTAMLCTAKSHSTIIDTIYPGRFNHCIQLNRMGADIIMKESYAVIPGNRELKGAWVHATDVRAGFCLVLAGLAAEGNTYITGVEHIERGYEGFVRDFSILGADIKLFEEKKTEEFVEDAWLLEDAVD